MKAFLKDHCFIAGFIGILFLCGYVMFGCVGTNLDPAALEGKQLGKFLVSTWNKAVASYRNQLLWPNLTPDEIKILRGKREFLIYSHDGVSDVGDYIEVGDVVPDATLTRVLNLLDRLQRGWLMRVSSQSIPYKEAENLKNASDAQIKALLIEVGIISEFEARMSPVLLGSLIELIRTGIHAGLTLLEMRGETEEQIAAWWQYNWPLFKTYDFNKLPNLNPML